MTFDRSEYWDAPKFGGQEDKEKQAKGTVANETGENPRKWFPGRQVKNSKKRKEWPICQRLQER